MSLTADERERLMKCRCGQDASMGRGMDHGWYQVQCQGCGVQGPREDGPYEAAQAWRDLLDAADELDRLREAAARLIAAAEVMIEVEGTGPCSCDPVVDITCSGCCLRAALAACRDARK